MILVSFGTRPEYIKLKPLMAEMKEEIPFKVLFTGQHTDLPINLLEPGYSYGIKVAYYDETIDMTVKNRNGYYALR